MSPALTEPGVAKAEAVARQKAVIRNVDFFYDKLRALKNVSLPLHDKRVTAFIGPSGCGKSTLLRVLNRIYELYPGQRATGEVLVDGETSWRPDWTSTCRAPRSAWSFRSRHHFRCRSTITSPLAYGFMRS